MEILAAYDLTGSYRDAAALVGCSHHTIARYVRARDAGELRTTPAERSQVIDPYREKIEEWIDASRGRVRADVAQRKLEAMGYTGSERATRRAVAEPESDGGFVNAMGEQIHGAAVAQNVRRDCLGGQRWTRRDGSGHVPVDHAPDGVAAEALASLSWEQRVALSTCPFGKPGAKYRARLLTQWGDPVFAALAPAAH